MENSLLLMTLPASLRRYLFTEPSLLTIRKLVSIMIVIITKKNSQYLPSKGKRPKAILADIAPFTSHRLFSREFTHG